MPSPSKVPRAQFRRTTRVPPSLNVALVVGLLPAVLTIYSLILGFSSGDLALSGRAVLGLMVAFGPGVLLLLLARAGHWWARAVITLGSLVVLIATVVNAANLWVADPDGWGFVLVSNLLTLLMIAAPVVLLWLPASNAYFRAVAVEKRQFRESMLR